MRLIAEEPLHPAPVEAEEVLIAQRALGGLGLQLGPFGGVRLPLPGCFDIPAELAVAVRIVLVRELGCLNVFRLCIRTLTLKTS